MKKLLTYLSSILLLIVVFSNKSCTKDKNDCFDCTDGPRDTLYIEKDFLDYWYAETGSWWVFKRTDTVGVDIYDTMRVVFHKREIDFHHYYGVSAFEYIFIRIEHQENSDLGDDLTFIETEKGVPNAIYYDSEFASMAFGQIKYPFQNQQGLSYEIEGNITLETTYKNLDNTYIFKNKSNPNNRLYLSKNIGFSRIELINGEIWELVNCHVIRTQ